MNIRPFQESDMETVIALWRACDLVRPWNDPHKDIQRKLAVGRELFLVGEVAGLVVASAMGGYEGHRGWVNYLAVHPEYRRHGYGRTLMRALEERLLALGCPKLNLQVRESNTAVIQFYEAIGYNNDQVVSFGKRLIAD
ncbi:MAG: GNAT family acetyltransferase [Anaerolineae bacterium]|nr:GNAT family acetyltransferase [Anaerolineae bacterium]